VRQKNYRKDFWPLSLDRQGFSGAIFFDGAQDKGYYNNRDGRIDP
jgi:hypothetical protein